MKPTVSIFSFLVALFVLVPHSFAADLINAQGKPKSSAIGKTEHCEVWHDHGGWHLRTYTADRGSMMASPGEEQ